MALTKTQIADELAAEGLGGKRQIINILNGLAELAADEVAKGEDFTVPGIARLKFSYRAPQKKGSRYKKGDTYTGFGGVVVEDAPEDSKPVSERITLRATATGVVAKFKPGTKPEAQKEYLKSKAGKAARARLRKA